MLNVSNIDFNLIPLVGIIRDQLVVIVHEISVDMCIGSEVSLPLNEKRNVKLCI